MKTYISIFFGLAFVFACGTPDNTKKPSTSYSSEKPTIKNKDGELLFKVKCAACHAVDKKLIGPPLAGVTEQWESTSDLYTYVRNPQDARDKGIARAIEIEDYDPSIMNPFPELTDEQLDQIFAYVKEKAASK